MKKCFFSLLLFFYGGLSAFVTANRDLMIFCECGRSEDIWSTKNHNTATETKGLGAISSWFLTALWQQAAPILVPESLFKNIIDHKKLFDDFATKTIMELTKDYGRYSFADKFTKIQELQSICQYSKRTYESMLTDLKSAHSEGELEILGQQNINYRSNLRPAYFNNYYYTAGMLLMCAFCPFDKYIIEKILVGPKNESLFLFIPTSYLSDNKLTLNSLGFKNIASGFVTSTTPLIASNPECYQAITAVLPQLMTLDKQNDALKIAAKKEELFKRPLPQQKNEADFLKFEEDTIKNRIVWAVIIAGHGRFNKVSDEKQLFRLQAERSAALNELKEIVALQASNPTKNYSGSLRIKQTKFDSIDEAVYPSSIAGMPLPSFKKIINFFNDQVYTSMLFYSSCGSGGQNMIDPYKEITTDNPINLSYAIAGGAITEAVTYATKPYIVLPEYSISFPITSLSSVVDFATKTVKIHTPYNYKKYFTELHTEREKPIPYTELFALVDNFKSQSQKPSATQIVNIPSLRLPGLQWFSILDVDKSILRISNVMVSVQGAKPLKIKNKKALLIDAISIDAPLLLTPPLPIIISTAPGTTQHYFKEFKCEKCTVESVVNSFFPTDVIHMSSKLFKIGELITSEGSFYNIEIFINTNKNNGIYGSGYCTQWASEKPVPTITQQKPSAAQPQPCSQKEKELGELNKVFISTGQESSDITLYKPSHFTGIAHTVSSGETGKRTVAIEHISLKTLGATLQASYQKRLAKDLKNSLINLAESLRLLAQKIKK